MTLFDEFENKLHIEDIQINDPRWEVLLKILCDLIEKRYIAKRCSNCGVKVELCVYKCDKDYSGWRAKE